MNLAAPAYRCILIVSVSIGSHAFRIDLLPQLCGFDTTAIGGDHGPIYILLLKNERIYVYQHAVRRYRFRRHSNEYRFHLVRRTLMQSLALLSDTIQGIAQ